MFGGYPERRLRCVRGIQYRVASIALHLGTDSWTYLERAILEYSTFHTVGLLVLALSRSHVSEGQAASL